MKMKKELTPDGYSKICGFMGCENKSDIWFHISIHCCEKGTSHTSCCKECIDKIFGDDK